MRFLINKNTLIEAMYKALLFFAILAAFAISPPARANAATALDCPTVDTPTGIEADLLSAVSKGNASEVKKLLAGTSDVNFSTPNGLSLLHTAVRNESVETVRLLLEHGSDVNAEDCGGRTPFMTLASSEGKSQEHVRKQLEIANLLLESHADINDSEGIPPIWRAAGSGQTSLVKWLLDRHANVNATAFNITALSFAVQAGYIGTAKALIDGGADTSYFNAAGQGVLTEAVQSGDIKLVQLIAMHAPLHSDRYDIQPIDIARQRCGRPRMPSLPHADYCAIAQYLKSMDERKPK